MQKKRQMKKIIDSHCHIFEILAPQKEKNINISKLIDSFKKNGVHKAVLLAIDGFSSNRFVENIYKTHKEFFWIFYNFNPFAAKVEDSMAELDKGFFSGVKIHPRLHGFSLQDKNIINFFKKLETSVHIPVLVDAWFSDHDPDKLIKELIWFVNEFNGFDIILAHSGGFKFNKIVELAGDRHVYVDTSYILNTFVKYQKYDMIEGYMKRLKQIDSSKILFGSDYPECEIKESIQLVSHYLNEFGFSLEDKEKIFFSNSLELLNRC